MLTNNSAFRSETPYNGPFEITQCCTNDTVTLKCGVIKVGIIYIALSHIHLIQTLDILNVEECV